VKFKKASGTTGEAATPLLPYRLLRDAVKFCILKSVLRTNNSQQEALGTTIILQEV
jgi:hypothetical protein